MSQTSRRSTQPGADVQARLTGVADWDVQPAYTLVMADADTRPMTERETADAILRAAGGEITEGTAVYLDGALRFVTDEGDHLRQFLYAVRAPWQTDGVQTDFVHALRLVGRHLPCRGHHTVPRPDRRTAGGRPFAGQGRAVRDRDPGAAV